MNPLAVKAGVLAVASFVLLLPTFNALNSSHFEATEPPFQFDNPPPDMEPPPDMTPPTGDGEYEGEYEGPMPEGGACAEFDHHNRLLKTVTFSAGMPLFGSPAEPVDFDVPPGGLALVLIVNYTEQFQGNLDVVLSNSDDSETYRVARASDGPYSAGPAWTNADDPWRSPAPGPYTILPEVSGALYGAGTVDVNFVYPVCKTPTEEAPADE